MNLHTLFILRYCSGAFNVEVIRALDSRATANIDATINAEKGTWTCKKGTFVIGEKGPEYEPGKRHVYGVIGIYDAVETSHMNAMMRHAHEALMAQYERPALAS